MVQGGVHPPPPPLLCCQERQRIQRVIYVGYCVMSKIYLVWDTAGYWVAVESSREARAHADRIQERAERRKRRRKASFLSVVSTVGAVFVLRGVILL